jgi:hypothetical protein
MYVQNKLRKLNLYKMLPVVSGAVLFVFSFCYGAVMQSTNYGLDFDSVNTTGGNSGSASYNLEDTVGEIGTGQSSSANYTLLAGYQQNFDGSISISAPSDISLTNLSTSQNSAVGSTTWTVFTDHYSGFTLSVSASQYDALRTATSTRFTDLASTTPTFWSVSNSYKFGFSIRGADVNTSIFGSDTDCINTINVPSATLKWRGFASTTPIAVASTSNVTSSPGTDITLCVATEQNGVFAPSGIYTATITATAVTN